MNTLSSLVEFLQRLEERKIYFKLNKIRDSILVEIAVPGQRWEVEFMADGTIEVEKFISTGTIFDHNEIEVLFRDFSD
ncbi:MAG: hypothetical protein FWG87_08005 [Defluviitaleaceae bacterium]|nr:hypothetical protein [Defluviitaleaceae bacterium]